MYKYEIERVRYYIIELSIKFLFMTSQQKKSTMLFNTLIVMVFINNFTFGQAHRHKPRAILFLQCNF